MASCVECNVKMGYSETNASRNHDGLCIACYVKSLVKTKINVTNNTKKPTNARSLDHLFEKFENITLPAKLRLISSSKKALWYSPWQRQLLPEPHMRKESFRPLNGVKRNLLKITVY